MVGGANFHDTSEAKRNTRYRIACTLSNLYAVVASNAATGSSTFRSRKNGSNGSQSVSIGAGSTGEFEDTSNSDSISAGDQSCFQFVNGTGGTVFFHTIGMMIYVADSNAFTKYGNGVNQNETAASSTYYNTCIGNRSASHTLESSTQVEIQKSITAKNMTCYIDTNGRSTSTTLTFRKNGADGNQSLSIPASTTGEFEDTSNTDSLIAGDDINYKIVTGTGTGTISLEQAYFDFQSSDGHSMIVAGHTAGRKFSNNQTAYQTVTGRINEDITTEANSDADANFDFTWKELNCRIVTNSLSAGNTTITARVGGADGNQTLSIGAGVTGLFADNSNTDTVVASNELTYKVVTPNTSGTFAVGNIGSIAETQFTATKTFTMDAVIEGTKTKTFTIDSVIEEVGKTKTFTMDAIIQLAGLTKTFTIDTVITAASATKTFTIDAIIEGVKTATFTIDSIIQKIQTKTFTIDSVIQKILTKTFTIDSVIQSVKTKTFTLDTIIKGIKSKTFTIDAFISDGSIVTGAVRTFSLYLYNKTVDLFVPRKTNNSFLSKKSGDIEV